MIDLPRAFIERMKSSQGEAFEDFLNSYSAPVVRGIRVNTLKISVGDFKKISPFTLDGEVPWEKNGFYVDGEGLGKSALHAAGLYYVQEPSAMCAAPRLKVKRGERVLDLCAAPGGKGTQLAQSMQGKGVLVLNEIVKKRAEILRSNVERTGVKNAVVTCADPARLACVFENYFDKILVDAPCSGEGMFKKEANAIPEWSEDNVLTCARRQAEILDCAVKMLSGGGRLVYSTCTFAPEEDEEQVRAFLKKHKSFALVSIEKLLPHEVRGEGHFCAVFEKSGGERRDLKEIALKPVESKLLKVYREWESDTLKIKFTRLMLKNFSLYYVAEATPDLSGFNLAHNFGVFLGSFSADGKRFEPAHSLAMCLKKGEVKGIDIDARTALNYLRGLTLECDPEIKGWRAVTYLGYPLGWCKAVNGTAKNHLPKGLRI